MNVLVLGGGGREHAIAWKIKQSRDCSKLFCMPGNPGTAQIATNIAGSPNDFAAVKTAVQNNKIDIVVVGPEEPLVLGLRDKFMEDSALKSVLFVGPSASGARLEGSKEFAKEFMTRHQIPTAAFKSFCAANLDEADKFLESLKAPYVLKADGLAAGKGVLILDDLKQAKRELRNMVGGKFGAAGNTVVIEQFMKGIEVSIFILTDGKDYLVLPEAKDYKRIGDGDTGLNTGGMGAVSPVPFVTGEFMKKIEERIIKPTIRGIQEEKIDYKGFIFIGLINCGGEPYVIEYNVRMGDPETEAVMTRIDSDLLHHLVACAKGNLGSEKIIISPERALTVVCVSAGYPQEYKKGIPMDGDDLFYNNTFSGAVKIFHSGTKETVTESACCSADSDARHIVTNGGRVLTITANTSAEDNCTVSSQHSCNNPEYQKAISAITAGREIVYKEIENIKYDGKYCRRDIGEDIIKFCKENN
ncbi:MAG: phosphoribosylamine--glycine ligase [Bacteroidales bacterium]|nr:phosphoribosylamine--glycine ligase [Bacteroidales bacterium]MDD4420848.1 phosphoribosylamine--glycine ligase [Bacteroidales bacterium]